MLRQYHISFIYTHKGILPNLPLCVVSVVALPRAVPLSEYERALLHRESEQRFDDLVKAEPSSTTIFKRFGQSGAFPRTYY